MNIIRGSGVQAGSTRFAGTRSGVQTFGLAGVLGLLLGLGQGAWGAVAPVYGIQDPGTLGGTTSRAFGINEFGIVVGVADAKDGRARGFRWRLKIFEQAPAPPVDLGPAAGLSLGAAINRTGVAAGYTSTGFSPFTIDRAFRGTEKSGLQNSGTLGGSHSQAYGINAAGQTTGSSLTSGNVAWHAFRLTNVQFGALDLGTLGGAASAGYGINAAGEVVGGSNTSQGLWHAFFWRDVNANGRSDPGEMRDLGTFGGSNSVAYGINAAGQVVGSADTIQGVSHAFRGASGRSLSVATDDLGTLGGNGSAAFAVNASGQVVGTAQTRTGEWRAFVFLDGVGMVDLNDRIDASPGEEWKLVEARSINDAGQIAGWGTHNGTTRAFMLTPVGVELPTDTSGVDLPEPEITISDPIPFPTPALPRDRLTVFRRADRLWQVLNSTDGSISTAQFGDGDASDWRPVPANYLESGFAQPAVFKPQTQEWIIYKDRASVQGPVRFGEEAGDIPVPGDYLGLKRSQLAIYRPNGEWRIRRDDGTFVTVGPLAGTADPSDIPVPADYQGTGRVQLAIFRQKTGEWFLRNEDGTIRGPLRRGRPGDIPVPGEYSHKVSGRAQLAVFQPDTREWWIWDPNKGDEPLHTVQLGQPGDIPVPGAYSGSTYLNRYRLDIAVYRPSTREWIFLTPDRWWRGTQGESAALRIRGPGAADPSDYLPAPGAYRFKLGEK